MINRTKLRGKPLDPDCRRAFTLREGDRVLCYALSTDGTVFDILPMCRACGAYIENAGLLKEGANQL